MFRVEAARVFDELWERFDSWYDMHRVIYESEVAAVEAAVGRAERIVEVGVGSGRFASRLPAALRVGVDPSRSLLRLAARRGVEVVEGVGEALPLRPAFNAALIIVTLCFVEEPLRVLVEAARVAEKVVSCIVPRGSSWGRLYSARRDSPFYKYARFYSVSEVAEMYARAGLKLEGCTSTLYTPPPGPKEPEGVARSCDEQAGFVCLIGSRQAP